MFSLFSGRLTEEIKSTYANLQRMDPQNQLYLNFTNIFKMNTCEHYFKLSQEESADTETSCDEDALLNSGLDTILIYLFES
jgi:hypothetical protein